MKGRTSRSNTARHMPRYACALLARRKRAVCIFWPPSDWVLKTRRKAGWVPFFNSHGVHGRDCFGHLAGSFAISFTRTLRCLDLGFRENHRASK